MRTLLWFRGKDLRLADHPALSSALGSNELLPLFVIDPCWFASARAQQAPHHTQFLLESVSELGRQVEARGSRLLLASGESASVLSELVRRWKVERIVAQAWTWPVGRELERRVRAATGVPCELFGGETLAPPGSLRTTGNTPYGVFTPFARSFAKNVRLTRSVPAPERLPPLPRDVADDALGRAPLPTLAELGVSHNPELQPGGESEARARLGAFMQRSVRYYHERRNRLDLDATSRLSCDLKFGTLSVREVWARAREHEAEGRSSFENELLWREFCYSTLWDRPELLEEPFQARFERFPWQRDDAGWRAWAEGKTGYPVVDAAARQLLQTGFVHNRARMISASFLTKHLLVDYAQGERHYMRYLTDGDEANNNAGWQWSAGSGCDAQPYFRIFNPVTQGRAHDLEGAYVRRWLPELAALPTRYIHEPWSAPASVLEQAQVRLGVDYPLPIVEHAAARQRFLDTARRHFGAP
jgi:deoxyribodipyrimidine photo-lyase